MKINYRRFGEYRIRKLFALTAFRIEVEDFILSDGKFTSPFPGNALLYKYTHLASTLPSFPNSVFLELCPSTQILPSFPYITHIPEHCPLLKHCPRSQHFSPSRIRTMFSESFSITPLISRHYSLSRTLPPHPKYKYPPFLKTAKNRTLLIDRI